MCSNGEGLVLDVRHARCVHIKLRTYALGCIPEWGKVFRSIAGPSNIEEILIDFDNVPAYLPELPQPITTAQSELDRVLSSRRQLPDLRRVCMSVCNATVEPGEVGPISREVIRALFPSLYECSIFVLQAGQSGMSTFSCYKYTSVSDRLPFPFQCDLCVVVTSTRLVVIIYMSAEFGQDRTWRRRRGNGI